MILLAVEAVCRVLLQMEGLAVQVRIVGWWGWIVLWVALVEAVVSEGAEGPVAGPGYCADCSEEYYLDEGSQWMSGREEGRGGMTDDCFPGDRFNEAVDDLGHCSC